MKTSFQQVCNTHGPLCLGQQTPFSQLKLNDHGLCCLHSYQNSILLSSKQKHFLSLIYSNL